MKVLERFDSTFFGSYLVQLHPDRHPAAEDESMVFQHNWTIVMTSLEEYIESHSLDSLNIESHIEELSEGQKIEIMNIFLFISSLFLMKNKRLWEFTLDSITDKESVVILRKIEKNIIGTPPESPRPTREFPRMATLEIPEQSYHTMSPSRENSMVLDIVDRLEDDLEASKAENYELKVKIRDIEKSLTESAKINEDKALIISNLLKELEDFKSIKSEGLTLVDGNLTTKQHASQLEDMRERLKIAEDQIDEAELRNSLLREEKINFEKEIRSLKLKNAVYKDVKNYESVNNSLLKQLDSLKKDFRGLEFKNIELKGQLEIAEKGNERIQKSLDQTRELVAEKDKEVRDLQNKVYEQSREITDLEGTISFLREKAEELQGAESESIDHHHTTQSSKISPPRPRKSLLDELADEDFRLQDTELLDEIEQLKLELSILKDEKKNILDNQLSSYETKLSSQKSEVLKLEGLIDSLKRELEYERESSKKQEKQARQVQKKLISLEVILAKKEEDILTLSTDPLAKICRNLGEGAAKTQIKELKDKHQHEISTLYSIIVELAGKEEQVQRFFKKQADEKYSFLGNLVGFAGI